ncbi:hypothetical protein [Pelagibacterium sediminicola]|uniref:hypothetical protein n=1 Tax=Pelagibacterium sediminicola TaxID=2248761 RepID=UPI003CCC549F
MWPGAESWFQTFFELGTDRQIGMGLGPIPAASIDRHVAGWPGADAQAFRQAIRAMDALYLKHHAKEPDVPETDNAARDAFRAAMR